METQQTFQPAYGTPNAPPPPAKPDAPVWMKILVIVLSVFVLVLTGLVVWLALERNTLTTDLSSIQKDISDGTISVVQNDAQLKNLKESISVETEEGEFADEKLQVGKVGTQSVVGINTENPTAELHVKGTSALGGDPDLALENADGSQEWVLTVEGANTNRFGLYNKTSNTNPFFIGTGAPNGAFFLDDRGFLGLGTVTPAQKLHVTGNVRIDGLTQAGFADQAVCFDNDGVLRPCRN